MHNLSGGVTKLRPKQSMDGRKTTGSIDLKQQGLKNDKKESTKEEDLNRNERKRRRDPR
jgi:hypothetical protein